MGLYVEVFVQISMQARLMMGITRNIVQEIQDVALKNISFKCWQWGEVGHCLHAEAVMIYLDAVRD